MLGMYPNYDKYFPSQNKIKLEVKLIVGLNMQMKLVLVRVVIWWKTLHKKMSKSKYV